MMLAAVPTVPPPADLTALWCSLGFGALFGLGLLNSASGGNKGDLTMMYLLSVIGLYTVTLAGLKYPLKSLPDIQQHWGLVLLIAVADFLPVCVTAITMHLTESVTAGMVALPILCTIQAIALGTVTGYVSVEKRVLTSLTYGGPLVGIIAFVIKALPH